MRTTDNSPVDAAVLGAAQRTLQFMMDDFKNAASRQASVNIASQALTFRQDTLRPQAPFPAPDHDLQLVISSCGTVLEPLTDFVGRSWCNLAQWKNDREQDQSSTSDESFYGYLQRATKIVCH